MNIKQQFNCKKLARLNGPSDKNRNDEFFSFISKYQWLDHECLNHLTSASNITLSDTYKKKKSSYRSKFLASMHFLSKGQLYKNNPSDNIKSEYIILSQRLQPYANVNVSFETNHSNSTTIFLSFELKDKLFLLIDTLPNNFGANFIIYTTI